MRLSHIYCIVFFIIIFSNLRAQHTLIINGTVVNENDEAVELAHVLINDHYLVSTDEDGNFVEEIEVSHNLINLKISHIAYIDQERQYQYNDLESKVKITLKKNSLELSNVILNALRPNVTSPFVNEIISNNDIEFLNLAKDVPQLLNNTTSMVASSDAGAGVGYNYLRIRGIDQTRINVTINGIPYNDVESQQVFWVDLPDITGSTSNIQIQRGVGSSTNGSSAFGGSINLNTLDNSDSSFLNLTSSYGSFNTQKYSAKFNLDGFFPNISLNGRASLIKSDGYVDRATSDLKSYYLNLKWQNAATKIDLVHFSGKERTYQAWNGVPQVRIENNIQGIENFIINNGLSDGQAMNIRSSDRRYNYYEYENEVDDYLQNHYQLHLRKIGKKSTHGISLHYTMGKGYFEQYNADDDLSRYGLNLNDSQGNTVVSGNTVRRRWLDNDFYGLVTAHNFYRSRSNLSLGGGINYSSGDHFGRLLSVENFELDSRQYYFGLGQKMDANIYTKWTRELGNKLNLTAEIQYRFVDYEISGQNNDLVELNFDNTYSFFNPKLGLSYTSGYDNLFFSFSIGNREPVRSDFESTTATSLLPKSERVYDFELGWRHQRHKFSFESNFYYMSYKDQLVPNGQLDDVGALVRVNVDNSYRTGIEISSELKVDKNVSIGGNLNLSRNILKNYTNTIYDYTNGYEVLNTDYENVKMALNPEIVSNIYVEYRLSEKLRLNLNTKYVGKQYLDNTQNEMRIISPYSFTNLMAEYQFNIPKLKNLCLNLGLYNIFNENYSTFGYSYTYIFGESITENFYYPQASRHFIVGLSIGI